MATIAVEEMPVTNHARRDALVIRWPLLTTTNDVGAGFEWVQGADRSFQVVGTFGVGGTIKLEGTNEETPTNWIVLTDPQGTAISMTAAAIEQVLELTRWVRPHVTAGDGATSLTAYLMMSAPRR